MAAMLSASAALVLPARRVAKSNVARRSAAVARCVQLLACAPLQRRLLREHVRAGCGRACQGAQYAGEVRAANLRALPRSVVRPTAALPKAKTAAVAAATAAPFLVSGALDCCIAIGLAFRADDGVLLPRCRPRLRRAADHHRHRCRRGLKRRPAGVRCVAGRLWPAGASFTLIPTRWLGPSRAHLTASCCPTDCSGPVPGDRLQPLCVRSLHVLAIWCTL